MYDKILPFIRQARAIRFKREDVPTSRILPPPVVSQNALDRLVAGSTWERRFPATPEGVVSMDRWIRVLPLDVYIPVSEMDQAGALTAVLLANKDQVPTFKAWVKTVDYADVYFKFERFETDTQLDIGLPRIGGYEIEQGVDPVLFDFVESNQTFDPAATEYRPLYEGIAASSLQELEAMTKGARALAEALIDDDDREAATATMGRTPDSIEAQIEQYLSTETPFGKCHLLIGLTGVAKSALVKNVCKKLGYRLVDFRAAFIDKLDLQGVFKINRQADGSLQYEGAPMRKIVECTDEYIEFAQGMVDYLTKQQDATGKDLSKSIAYFREHAEKTPVLFFDEITRAPKSIRNALFDIVDKKFMNYKMTKCRVIAATNMDLETDMVHAKSRKDPFTFATDDPDDLAFKARFNNIPVLSGDVAGRWLDWAKNGGVPYVLYDFLLAEYGAYMMKNPGSRSAGPLYDYTEVETTDETKASTTPYPNYRTWDLLGQYLKNKVKDADQTGVDPQVAHKPVVDIQVIQKLIGSHARSWTGGKKLHEALQKHLTSEGFEVVDSSQPDYPDPIRFRLEECIKAGIPMMMLGPTSLGKTSRVNAVSMEAFGVEPFKITLSQKDRTDMLGIPATLNIADLAMQMVDTLDGAQGSVDASVIQKLGEKIPGNISDYAVNQELAVKLQEAVKANRPVVLFFEEFTRADKTVQSAVFEAISDRRFCGVNFPEGLHVSVVAAGNYGAGYADTNQMDSAMAARFAMDVQDGYSPSDALAVLNFFKGVRYKSDRGRMVPTTDSSKAFHPAIVAFLEDLYNQDNGVTFTDMLTKTEDPGVTTWVRGTMVPRSWDDVNRMITLNGKVRNQLTGYKLLWLITERARQFGNDFLSQRPAQITGVKDQEALMHTLVLAAVFKAVLSNPDWILNNAPSFYPAEKRDKLLKFCEKLVTQIPTYDVAKEGIDSVYEAYNLLDQNLTVLSDLEKQVSATMQDSIYRVLGNYQDYAKIFYEDYYHDFNLPPFLDVWLALYKELEQAFKVNVTLTPEERARMMGMSKDQYEAMMNNQASAQLDDIDAFCAAIDQKMRLGVITADKLPEVIRLLVMNDLYKDPSDRKYPLVRVLNQLAANFGPGSVSANLLRDSVGQMICQDESFYRQVVMTDDYDQLVAFFEFVLNQSLDGNQRGRLSNHLSAKAALRKMLPQDMPLEVVMA